MMLPKKDLCCGCAACHDVCQFDAISMVEDDEGFRYPQIDLSKCRQCGKCESVCPAMHRQPARHPLSVFAARVKDDDRLLKASSSGGLFSLLAERTLSNGGVVFGAVWDKDWTTVHRAADDLEGIAPMRGSKYLQSRVDGCYRQAKLYLAEGRHVLFTGTPCQIAALRHVVGESCDRLLTVEVICHAVPSPRVWQSYLQQYSERLTGVSLRDKSLGWPHSVTRLDYADGLTRKIEFNSFIYAFAVELCNRPSCRECPVRSLSSGADVTIGDFGGIETVAPDMNDGKGVSCVLIHTEAGRRAFEDVRARCTVREAEYGQVLARNPNLEWSSPAHPLRRFFVKSSLSTHDFDGLVRKCVSASGLRKLLLRSVQHFMKGGSGR